MRNSWAIGLAALFAIAAGSAGAAEAKGQQSAADNPATEATKHVAVIEAGLESAEINADMLGEITKSAATYDRDHGSVFAKNITDSLAQAKAHLAHLEPLATSDAQKKQFQDLKQRTDKADTMARGLDAKLGNAADLNKAARELERELDGSGAPLQKLARDMNVTIDVG